MTASETKQFDAEVSKILHLMIHSLYTNKEIFLRELISNASDACDKLRFEAQSNDALLKDDPDFAINFSFDKEKKLLTITDNGIGMSKDELINNLGTIAKSGTQEFANALTGDNSKDMALIGQFGVGFYASFMVADEIIVNSIRAGSDKAHSWTSKGDGQYTIGDATINIKRGTSIQLHLKEDAEEFLDRFRLQHVIKTYSDHISIPVYLLDDKEEKTMVNSGKSLWTLKPSDVKAEEYQEFYKHTSYLPDEPWMTLHNQVEGVLQYTNLLFIPSSKPFNLFNPERQCQVKLYVKRVFITEEHANVIPSYLRFLRGIVDSDDLPLNISRETLQHNAVIDKIRKSLTKKVISELKKKATNDKEAYQNFWNNFGAVLKEGLCEGLEDRDKLLEVCLFTHLNKEDHISLDDYISNMQEGQNTIYYLIGESLDTIKDSPQLEGFKAKGLDVLLLTDSVDDFWVNVVHEYKGKSFKSITRSDIDLDNLEANETEDASEDETSNEQKKETPVEFVPLINFFKDALKEQVKDVKISSKLASSPVCLSVDDGSMDMRMERFLIDQNQLQEATLKNLEINPKHPIIQQIDTQIRENGKPDIADIALILFDQACVIEGEPIKNPGEFSKRMSALVEKAIAA